MSRTLNTDPLDLQLARLRGPGAPVMHPPLVSFLTGEILVSHRLSHVSDRSPEYGDAEWPRFAPFGGCNAGTRDWGRRDPEGFAPKADDWDWDVIADEITGPTPKTPHYPWRFTPVETISFDRTCDCNCNRCIVHDDHGGCTEPWNHRDIGVFHADSGDEGGYYS